MKKHALALIAMALTGSVMAETQPYATVVNAQGLSTVSVGNKLVNATNGMKLAEGAQVLTTAKSSVTVDFAGLCTATVKSGQALAVNLADCKSLLAQQGTQSFGSGSAAGGLAESASALGLSTVQIGLLAAVGVGAAYSITKNDDNTTTVTAVAPEPTEPGAAAPAPVSVTVPTPTPAKPISNS